MQRNLSTSSQLNSNLSGKFKNIVFLILGIHICYLLLFLFIGKHNLFILNIFSISLYIYVASILNSEKNLKLALIISRIEIFIHATICSFELGWDYGFWLIILALTSVVLFSGHIGRIFSYSVSFLDAVAYITLYVYLKDKPPYESSLVEFIYLFNFLVIVVGAIIFSSMLRVVNTVAYFDMLGKQEQLESTANKDQLTNLLNRRYFEKLVEDKVFDSKNTLSIVVGDLDNFKQINDTYGHLCGDDVLKNVANIIKKSIRRQDFAFRFGGEEFVLILANTSFVNSKALLERTREKIAKHTYAFGGAKVNVSITFGFVHILVDKNFELETAIKEADDMLNYGKRSGKNRVSGKVLIFSKDVEDIESEII